MGIATAAVILVVGVVLFRNSGETAVQLVGAAAFVGAFAVYLTLGGRAHKRQEKRS